MKRPLVLLIAISVVLGCGTAAYRLVTPGHRIHRGTFDTLESGMTRAEVEERIGLPPGDYRSESARYRSIYLSRKTLHPKGALIWSADVGDCSNVLWVTLDDAGRVSDKGFESQRLPCPSWWDVWYRRILVPIGLR